MTKHELIIMCAIAAVVLVVGIAVETVFSSDSKTETNHVYAPPTTPAPQDVSTTSSDAPHITEIDIKTSQDETPDPEPLYKEKQYVSFAPSGEKCIVLSVGNIGDTSYDLLCNERGANVKHEDVLEFLLSAVGPATVATDGQ